MNARSWLQNAARQVIQARIARNAPVALAPDKGEMADWMLEVACDWIMTGDNAEGFKAYVRHRLADDLTKLRRQGVRLRAPLESRNG
jgi:hypothetical protein